MIKSENRLRKNKHFRYIYKHGETKTYKVLTVTFVETKFKTIKVGFSVSKKIGKSVVRNKVKRRLRESFVSLQRNIKPNRNYIFTAKQGIENLDFHEIRQNMMEILKKNGLYIENN